jgi:hypothetical protein
MMIAVSFETCVTEIAIELVLAAEIRYRERTIHQYGWRVERKAQLEEEELDLNFISNVTHFVRNT